MFARKPSARTRGRLIRFGCVLAVLLVIHALVSNSFQDASHAVKSCFKAPESFESFSVSGFANIRVPNKANCEDIRVPGALSISPSFHLTDDMLDIATSVAHPMIDYSGQKQGQSFIDMVEKTWSRTAGSSVWLEKYQVFLTVTRVFFYDKGVKQWPVIQFIRAQMHDAAWKELVNHTIEWQGERITFPRMLDVDAPYIPKGGFFGPEDPRIIIEQGVDGAEPVVIFNMHDGSEKARRGMYAHRPFSNFTTHFNIKYQEPLGAEKNWAPFFMPRPQAQGYMSNYLQDRYPSHHMYFLYDWHPLRVLRCHLLNGACIFVYKQEMPEAYVSAHKHNDTKGAMRGGTNFEPLPPSLQNRPGLTSWVSLGRTHMNQGCGEEGTYRPEMIVLTTDGTSFWVDYSSEAITFGSNVLSESEEKDTCKTGRILIANSIARVFDDTHGDRKDTMTVTFSVGDMTVQIADIKGTNALIAGLPQFRNGVMPGWHQSDMTWNMNVTSDVIICSVQSAADYAIRRTTKEAKVGYDELEVKKLKEEEAEEAERLKLEAAIDAQMKLEDKAAEDKDKAKAV